MLLEQQKAIISKLYADFVGMGLNSHFPGPNTIGMWPEEIMRLMWCELNSPKLPSVVIGSHNCGSELVIALCKNVKGDNSPVIGIDIKFGDFADLNIKRVKSRVNGDIIKWEIDSGRFGEMFHEFTNRGIGLALIDGYHSYEKCLDDFKQVDQFLTSNSICLFHDCSPIYPKRGQKLPDNFVGESEDFRMDEAIDTILQSPDFEELEIPVGDKCDRRKEAQRPEWIRGQTSPFNSLFAINIKELFRT